MKIAECGFVYMITSPNNRIYVGSTLDFDRRFDEYNKLRCKEQTKLYNSLNKYGVDSHIFEVVWAGLAKEMYKYETLIGWGYNVLEPDSGLNLKLPKLGDVYKSVSNETLIKISNALLNTKRSQLTKDNMVKAWKNRLPVKDITRTKLKDYWKNLSKDKRDNLKSIRKDIIISDATKDKMSRSNSNRKRKVSVYQKDLLGNIIKEWDSIKEASIALSIDSSSITKCCKNIKRYKSPGGFIWRYKN